MLEVNHFHLPDGQAFYVERDINGGGTIEFRNMGWRPAPSYPRAWTVCMRTDGNAVRGSEWKSPTLCDDSLEIWSPKVDDDGNSAHDLYSQKVRRITSALWVTLYWYFTHKRPPPGPVCPVAARETPLAARPVVDWRIRVRPKGGLAIPMLLEGLERTGLVACDDTAVSMPAGTTAEFFASQPAFWQLPLGFFAAAARDPAALPLVPPPLQYIMSPSNGTRHPRRPRPPPGGTIFYSRWVPSIGRYLAFRLASASPDPVLYNGPMGMAGPRAKAPGPAALGNMSDSALLASWHAQPRVAEFWGEYDSGTLGRALASQHSFPVIGLWDGAPFGYFEVYWAKEDLVGRYAGGTVGDWERGVHVLVGEEWARGRVAQWLTALVHWCFAVDARTEAVCLEPRVDNERMLGHLDALGFAREKQLALPHKQAWYVRLRRESWRGPAM